MAVYIAAVLATLFYAANIPMCAALGLRVDGQTSLQLGVGLFRARPRPVALTLKGRPAQKMPIIQLLRLFLRLWEHMHLTGKIHAQLGAGDAAATALLCGTAFILLEAVGRERPLDVRIQPDFERAGVRLDASVRLSVKTWQLARAVVYLFLRRILQHGQASD